MRARSVLAPVVPVVVVMIAWAQSCTRANAAPEDAPPVSSPVAPAVPPTTTIAPKPPHDVRWQEVAARIGVDEATMRACKQTSDCTAMPHFTSCCSFVAVAKAHVGTVKKSRAKWQDLQTEMEALQCRSGECKWADSPVACIQGWCVLDRDRELWTRVAHHTASSPDALRACNVDGECTLTRNPERCCETVALAKSALPKVTALGDTLMTKQERESCAIKKCGDPGWSAVCSEGLCKLHLAR